MTCLAHPAFFFFDFPSLANRRRHLVEEGAFDTHGGTVYVREMRDWQGQRLTTLFRYEQVDRNGSAQKVWFRRLDQYIWKSRQIAGILPTVGLERLSEYELEEGTAQWTAG